MVMAKADKYEGAPAAGHKLAFANFLTSFPFCKSVEDGIIEQWKLAGGSVDDLKYSTTRPAPREHYRTLKLS